MNARLPQLTGPRGQRLRERACRDDFTCSPWLAPVKRQLSHKVPQRLDRAAEDLSTAPGREGPSRLS
jgi:hypothetical protein